MLESQITSQSYVITKKYDEREREEDCKPNIDENSQQQAIYNSHKILFVYMYTYTMVQKMF